MGATIGQIALEEVGQKASGLFGPQIVVGFDGVTADGFGDGIFAQTRRGGAGPDRH